MTATGVPGARPPACARMKDTWVQDRLAHVREHSDADEPSRTCG
jgi:hypothetical protein